LRHARRYGLALSLALAATGAAAGPVSQRTDPGPGSAAQVEGVEPGFGHRRPLVVPAGPALPGRSRDEAPAPASTGLLGDPATPGFSGPGAEIVADQPWGAAANDLHVQASQSAAEAALGAHAAREGARALEQGYTARLPTWIQQAATVDLGDFPHHEDPTASSEDGLETLQWMLAERERLAAGQGVGDGSASGNDPDDGRTGLPTAVDREAFGALQLLLPSTWLPLLREHRDSLLAGAAGVLVASWIMGWMAARRRASHSRRSHRSRRSHHRAHGSRRHARHGDANAAVPALELPAVSPPAKSKRRRRHAVGRRDGSEAQPGAALATAHGSHRGGASRRRR
jgi:hypothetical protein